MQRAKRAALGLAAVMMMAGCSQGKPQAVGFAAYTGAIYDIKRQLAVYAAYSHQHPHEIPVRVGDQTQFMEPEALRPQLAPGEKLFACGNDQVGFEILSVKADLSAILANTLGGNVSGTLPMGTPMATGTLSGEGSRVSTSTQDSVFWAFPSRREIPYAPVSRETLEHAPIALALTNLRMAFTASATTRDYNRVGWPQREPTACVTTFDPDNLASPSGTFTSGLEVKDTGEGKFSVNLTVLSFGVNGERASTTGNTLLATFRQVDLDRVKKAQDRRTAACKPPNQNSLACVQATFRVPDAMRGYETYILRPLSGNEQLLRLYPSDRVAPPSPGNQPSPQQRR